MRILLTLALTACGLTAVQIQERERCYERAEAAAQARVDRECPDLFTTCQAGPAILAELQREQERCP